MCEPGSPEIRAPRETDLRDHRECRAAQISAKANVDTAALELIDVELPGVIEDGMPGRNGQRKPGTARGSPRRSRTAKASRISRSAAKSRCACEWGGWGRISDDGSGHYNPNPSEGPWGGGLPTLHGGALSSPQVRLRAGCRCDHVMHEGRRQTTRWAAHAGSRLRLPDGGGRSRLKSQPLSRTGKNPPYGISGGTMETSASFEARSAPSSYPTPGSHRASGCRGRRHRSRRSGGSACACGRR